MSLAICESVEVVGLVEFMGRQKPKFSLFEEVVVDWGECPQRGWIVGIEFYDALAAAAATNDSPEPIRVKDVALDECGSWEYVISFQIGLTLAGDAPARESIQVSERCISPVLSELSGKRVAA